MVSAAMAVEEQHVHSTSDRILLESNITDNGQSKEQFNTGDGFPLKVRKPYTITKQRERWTEEEHERFLEALKLYGRAWRKIEEHVGTKTAVQIRSHAQKFFSKIVRESSNGETTDAKAIEIPPARPKRKPMHPYPRKLVSPALTGSLMPEKLTRSVSQDSSISVQDNQSPTSVLSANSSDVSVQADTCTPNGGLSPVSSTFTLNASTGFDSEAPKVTSDDARSEHGHEDGNSNSDEEVRMNLELLTQNNDQSAVQCVKLFGKTLLVEDPFGTSYSAVVTFNPECLDKSEKNCFYPQTTKIDKPNTQEACSPVPSSWLTLCAGASLSTGEEHSPTPIKVQPCRKNEKLEKNEQNEVSSSSSSNADIVSSLADEEKSWDVDSFPPSRERKGNVKKSFSSKLSKRTSANFEDCRKGFVPYKRRSLTKTAKQREQQQSRICL